MQSAFLPSAMSSLTDFKNQRRSSVNQLFQAVTNADISRLPVDRRLPDFVVYRSLSRFVMSKDRMVTYGYPVPDERSRDPGKVVIPQGIYPTTPNFFNSNQRKCSRCKEIFQVKEDGTPVLLRNCFYHRGILKPHPRTGIMNYTCCYKTYSSEGCKVSDSHVVDGSGHPDYDRNFRQTVRRNSHNRTRDNCPGVYALDCEMCNTSIGIEVTKVTLVDWRFDVVYESLVKPAHPILDYNTIFSGLQEGDLDHVTTTLADVQDQLLDIISADTILIGHALRNDLKSLKIVHMKVIDTEDVFPHPRGLPFTRSLKIIVQEQFNLMIQMFDHDSKQDAIACMNLMLRQVLDELLDYENAMKALMQFCS